MIQSLHIGCLYDKKSERSRKAFEVLNKEYNLNEINLQAIENYDVIITLGGGWRNAKSASRHKKSRYTNIWNEQRIYRFFIE